MILRAIDGAATRGAELLSTMLSGLSVKAPVISPLPEASPGWRRCSGRWPASASICGST
jgi:hypothetical protein